MRFAMMAAALAACTPAPQQQAPDAPAATTTTAATTAGPTASSGDAMAEMPSWDGARAAGVDFRAVGQEPGWMLDIYQRDKIKLIWSYGEHSAEFPLPAPDTTQEGATRYAAQANGHTLAVTIRRFPCQDAMSGQAYPSAVSVTIDGAELRGCGKSV